jgi:hypothetical protein
LLYLVFVKQRKEVIQMKLTKTFFAAVLFTSVVGGALSNAVAEDGIVSKDALATATYCHEKFPAMTTQTLDSDNPSLSSSGAIVDFYGPCAESPVGQDQIQAQKLDEQMRFRNGYED